MQEAAFCFLHGELIECGHLEGVLAAEIVEGEILNEAAVSW